NFLKKLAGWRLEYFYIDFSIGFLLTAVLLGQTLGSGAGEPDHFARLLQSGQREVLFAAVGGFIWNLGNILLLNSIMIAGLAVAFPIAAIPAIVLGIGASYLLQPVGNPMILATSAVILLAAAQTTAAAYRRLGDVVAPNKGRGIATALISGLLIGFFPPFVTAAITGEQALDAYTVSTFFTAGAFVATLIAIPILIRRPLIGDAGRLGGYFQGRTSWHVFGLLAGAVWCSGTVFNFISAGMVGIAISVGIGSGAPMVGALWGVFLWREFAKAQAGARALIAVALLLYVIGVAAMSVAYKFQ
ncbi:MAG: GRP family sugar transporter, partial [Steroidobacteraceae bacterium]